ncbi:BTAD domain-containing putative transcriptional regulator [Amycolatopsis aidingensis]|uniref:BTAD domain-containing putative transcriptional regulator n=1 Tax=Amycolatopsis aidingensis TaxID=2842453 RepID=UPI001C0A98AD|nr:BTAD domain-containing putative transcriptional regulator [Amycolatopsis aidingensis]
MSPSVRFAVLGPLVAEGAHGPVDLKGPRHRAVLARLLVARGRVVPVDLLIDDLWEVPPDGAAGAVQTFVAALRRALEPERAPRAPARLLVTAASGYALRAEPDSVDAFRFEAAVTAAGAALASNRAATALATMAEALAWWRGPAYAEFGEYGWARAEAARLDELHLLAQERHAEALVALDRAAEAVPELEAQVAGHPWREEAWRLLALARYRCGRQGDALDTLRRARQVLAAELGLDPGPGLRALESDILAQAAHLAAPGRPSATEVAAPAPPLVGREEAMARVRAAASAARTGPGPVLVLVAGEAGAGKTALAEAGTTLLAGQGWTTAWGGNPEHEGLPAAWPWTRILDTLAAGHEPAPAVPGVSTSDPAVARFHWHRAVGDYLTAVARQAPLLLVLDDLHWAGEETLALLESVATEPAVRPVLLIVTYRTTDVPAALAGFLGRIARTEPSRIYLGGLPESAIPELVRAVTGKAVQAALAGVIHRRSGGNPFFVRELARLLDTEGAAGLDAVPPGVRDVVRYRLACLPDVVRAVLHQAAVFGTELDLEPLTAVAGEAGQVLDAVEIATRRGFLTESAPGRFRFAHALVRDTLYEDISRSRRAAWHAAVAEVLERLRPDDVQALAHHFLLAESPATADRAARYARAAAEQAERRFAAAEAARLWRAAAAAHDRSGSHDIRERIELSMGVARALAVTGALAQARQHRAEAITLAATLDDPAPAARAIGAFEVPALWTENDDQQLAHRVVRVAERTLDGLPPDRVADRARLLSTIALELRNTGGEPARAAAREAEAIARAEDEPALLALALNARFIQSFERAGLAPERVELGAELVDLAARHELVTFEVLGHLVLVQAHSALADFAAADRHAELADRLGERYLIPLVPVFTRWYRALRTAATGPRAEGEAAYRAAAAGLAGTGMSGLDNGILPLALLCNRLQHGDSSDVDISRDFGGYQEWCRPILLRAAGRLDRAQVAAIPESPRDLLYEARTCLHASVAVEFADPPALERLYADLRPAAAELAGAGSGLLTLRPVAHYLGDLAVALGRRNQAAEHYEQAAAIATGAGAAHWAQAARAARASAVAASAGR